MQTHGTTEITICCRIRDYQMLTSRLTLRSAICIQPLNPEQINFYFEQAGEQLSALKTVLQQDKGLEELATSPLILSVMSLVYQGFTPEQITLGGKTEDYRKCLFETYVDRMFQRRGTTQQYPRTKTQQWLIWLAQRMTAAAQTVFLIERLQQSWLPKRGQRICYRFESGLIGGLIIWGSCVLLCGLYLGQFLYGNIDALISLLNYVVIGSLGIGFSVGLAMGLLRDIQPVETIKWSCQSAKKGCRSGLNFGLIFGLIFAIFFVLIITFFGEDNGKGNLLFLFFMFGFMYVQCVIGSSLFGCLFGGFRGPEIQQKGEPNQGIWKSLRNSIIFVLLGLGFGLILGLCLGLSFNWFIGFRVGLWCGLILGLIGGLIGGGTGCIRHAALRQKFYRLGYSPWNYVSFLDYATERLFLQKVGGGYIFVHRMLMEHFAEMSLERGQR
jgi:hypothetical protein